MGQNKQIFPPDLTAVLNELKDGIFKSLNCINVGFINSFDASTQTATVQIAIKKIKEIQEDGTRIIQERPLLLECPVVILSGGVTSLTFPIVPGDECLVFFNDREIDNWFNTGQANAPTTFRAHDLSDAFALVGVRSSQRSIVSYLENGIRLFHSTARIDILADQIETLASLFEHTGDMEISNDLTVKNDATVENDATIENDATVENDLFVDNFLSMKDTTAPVSTPTDSFSMYGDDQAGDKIPHFRTNSGFVVKLFPQVHISDPTGGVVQDANARTAIDAILDILETNGLMLP